MLSLALLVCALTFCSAHFFSATGDMRRMVELEKEIVEVLKEHKEQLESSLETIRSGVDAGVGNVFCRYDRLLLLQELRRRDA